jgi:hypothetical protein
LVYNFGPLEENLINGDINPQNKDSFLNLIKIFKDWLCFYGRSLGPLQQLNLATLAVGTTFTVKKTASAVHEMFSWTVNKLKFFKEYFEGEKSHIKDTDFSNKVKIDRAIEKIDARVEELLRMNPASNRLFTPRFRGYEDESLDVYTENVGINADIQGTKEEEGRYKDFNTFKKNRERDFGGGKRKKTKRRKQNTKRKTKRRKTIKKRRRSSSHKR